ncbi:MAG: four helix bundle protein, partial [Oryzomonas sp.]
MARYEHLPIYRSAMKLAVHLENVVRGFPRYTKYTLGSDMRVLAQQIVGLIISANGEQDKLSTLLDLRTHVERLLVQARICQETNGFKTFASFAATVELAG